MPVVFCTLLSESSAIPPAYNFSCPNPLVTLPTVSVPSSCPADMPNPAEQMLAVVLTSPMLTMALSRVKASLRSLSYVISL
jgi:hypothetical protein